MKLYFQKCSPVIQLIQGICEATFAYIPGKLGMVQFNPHEVIPPK